MARKKYVLKRPKNPEQEVKDIQEMTSRMSNKNLELTRSMEVKRYGKSYVKMIFETPKDED